MENTIGKRIAHLRKQRGLTQEELSEKLNVSAQAVSKWENDQSCPDILLLPALARLLGVTVDELLSGERPQPMRLVPEAERKPIDELMVYINVADVDGEVTKITLPVAMLRSAMELNGGKAEFKIGLESGNMEMVDPKVLLELIEKGFVGTLVEVEATGVHVEIKVE